MLKGALVQVSFNLTRYAEPGHRGKPPLETYIANLDTIHMIDEAIPLQRLWEITELRGSKRKVEEDSDEEPEQGSSKGVRRSKRLIRAV